MAEKTVEFCGELQSETDLCWFVFDGINTVKIPKSQVSEMRKLNSVDVIMQIPLWLAIKNGVV